MTELQKHSKTATKEQMRLAELIQGRELGSTNDDVAAQKRVKKIIELTNCTPSVAEVALIDCEGSVEAAVALLLDKPDEIVLWSQQSGKTRKSKSTTAPATNGSSSKPFNQSRRRVDDELPSNKPFNQSRRRVGDELNKPFSQSRRKADDELPSNKPFSQSRRKADDELPSNNNKPFNQSRRKAEDELSGNKTFNQSRRKVEDEWKTLPRVFEPSSVTTNSANVVVNSAPPANATPSWPSLDNNSEAPTSTLADLPQIQQNKPKTFASVAATKKAPPPPPPQPVKALSSTSVNEGSSSSSKPVEKTADVAKGAGDGGVTEWSSSVDWGTAALSPPPAEPSPARQTALEQQAVTASEVFGSSGHSMNVNQKYTDDLKSVIGLGSAGKSPINQSAPNPVVSLNSMDTFQQQISQFTKPSMAAPTTTTELGKKVEFATGDYPPPVADASAYQFGFQFKDGGIPSAASLNDAWSNKPHISTVELDRSMLKDAAVNVLSTMTNIPTTSSNVTAHAHFSTSAQQQQQAAQSQHDFQRNSSSRSAALSFTDTASVNYPPANNVSGMTMNGGTAAANLPPQQQQNAGIPSTAQQQPQPQQQQQSKPVYTASNQSMVINAQQQHLQHLQQQQSQALYHQTSAAAAPTAVPQFPGYNMPYPMYSPAPAMPGQNAELERFFMQPQYAPYGGLEVQLNSMSLGPPTTLAPSHRNPMETFMDNKFAPNQQQQSGNFAVNQGNPAAALQHGQSGQQHRGQNETNAIFGASGQVAPPPGFSMPTAAVQQSFMPQANLQSLFQMPAYNPQMSYQQQYMMSNANRMPNSQRPAQTSPPEGNNGHQQRRHDSRGGPESQGYGGGGGPDSVDHSAGGAGSAAAAQSYIQKFNYRQYM